MVPRLKPISAFLVVSPFSLALGVQSGPVPETTLGLATLWKRPRTEEGKAVTRVNTP